MNSNKQRQQAFRARLKEKGLKPCEIWLDERTKALLSEITTRYEGSRQENYTKVILAGLEALTAASESVTGNGDANNDVPRPAVTSDDPGRTVQLHTVTSNGVIGNIIDLSHGEKRCQAKTTRGTRCRVSHNLSVIPYRHGDQVYEILACRQHIDRFELHKSVITKG